MIYGLSDNILESIIEVFTQYLEIDEVILYGSRAKGNYKKGSDIDLALVGQNITIYDLQNILLGLDDLYLPYEFDLVIFKNIKNEELVGHINRCGITIYNKE